MKYPKNTRLALVAISAAALASLSTSFAQANKPIIITPPAVKDGSNSSRAPFAASRPQDDLKAPDAQPIDQNVPPNTPATNTEPNVLPEARVAVMQPAAPAANPGTLPTGRTSVAVASSLDGLTVVPTIRAATFESRDAVINDIETRCKACDSAMHSMRGTAGAMSSSGQTQFKSADEQVKSTEKALRKSVKAARKASAQEWDAARAQLASDYEAYAAALASVDVAAGVR